MEYVEVFDYEFGFVINVGGSGDSGAEVSLCYDSEEYDDTLSVNTLDLERQSREEWEAERNRLNTLSKKVRFLHTSVLFYRAVNTKIGELCFETCKSIVRKVGSRANDWSDLGYYLGISQDNLNYIQHSVRKDFTETVLRVYMQDENATLDRVVNAFMKMNRYDILNAVEEPLLEINQRLCKGNSSTSNSSGYGSGGNDNDYQIIRLKNIPNDLPEVLLKNYVPVIKTKGENLKKPVSKSKLKQWEKIEDGKPTVLLTFAEDGGDFAENIRDKIRSWKEDSIEVQILTLNDRKNEVLQNPQNIIRDYIQQAKYIIPIITEGYLKAIESKDQVMPGSADNLDANFARYIFTQLMHNYVFVDGCMNKKVRSVLPDCVDRNIVLRLPPYSVLSAWTCDIDFDKVFKDLLTRCLND